MKVDRRSFLVGGVGASLAARIGQEAAWGAVSDLAGARRDFPRPQQGIYLNHASQHPISIQTAGQIQKYADYLARDLTRSGWNEASPEARAFSSARTREVKELFARLINARPSEIAYCLSTTVGENIVFNGMGIQETGGNVVTNDLHYSSCLYHYKMRQRQGLDVRIVKHRDWQLDPADFARLIDQGTKLVALTWVSNVNGLVAPVSEIARIAHERGAYVYADIIQGAGAVPLDVRALGIDFAACSTYKWLMGLRGFAYLYVREDLQGSVVKPTQFGGGVDFNYPPWVDSPDRSREEIHYTPKKGAAQYEVGNISSIGSVAQFEALNYLHEVGVDRIQAHALGLAEQLRRELKAKGYRCITPEGNASPIVTFLLPDPKQAEERLRKAGIEVTLRFGNQMRVSVSVMNTPEEISRLAAAL